MSGRLLLLIALLPAACGGGGQQTGDTLWGCEPNSRQCDHDRVFQCNPAGDGWDLVADCTAFGTVCAEGVCVGIVGDIHAPEDSVTGPDTVEVKDTHQDFGPEAFGPTDTSPPEDTPPLEDTHQDFGPEAFGPTDTPLLEDTPPLEDTPQDLGPEGPPTDAPPTDTPPVDDTWQSTYGYLDYKKIPNLAFQGDFVDVAWRPDGSDALLLGQGGDLVLYDPDSQGLSALADLDGSPSRVAWQPDGDFAYIAGRDGDVPKLWRYTPGVGVSVEPFIDLGGLRLQSVQFHPEDGRAVVVGFTESPLINRAYVIAPPYDSVTAQQAWGGYPGMVDACFARPDLLVYDGAEFIITSEGWSGAKSRTWLTTQGTVLENGWKASFGNPGRATWHPERPLAVLVGTSSNVLYMFLAGTWDKVYTQDTGSNIAGFAWNRDGTRGLITGRSFGNPLKGTVVEYRLLEGVAATAGTFTDQSIPGFGSAPYNANSNTYLHAVAFRPGTDCEEGLIVGSDNGTSWSPTFGLAIRFEDPTNPHCGGTTGD